MSAVVSIDGALAPDSLLRIPLVRMMLADPWVRLRKRAIDDTWRYRGVLPGSLGGFNPALGAVFIGARSRMAEWLDNPEEGARELNEGDALF
jgi:hypothetical protein